MYSFAQRNDTYVVDEPLYAHYLRLSGADHPGKEEVLNSQENDGSKVIQQITSAIWKKPVVFFKQMTHHLIHLPLDFLSGSKNVLLIRNPYDVLLSYSQVIKNPGLQDIGIKQSYELFLFLERKKFHRLILDSNELLKDPEMMLKKLCESIGLPFQSEMLHWEKGGRPEDGIWAKYWYKNVHQSGGFTPFEKPRRELPARLEKIYEEARPYYDFLIERSLK